MSSPGVSVFINTVPGNVFYKRLATGYTGMSMGPSTSLLPLVPESHLGPSTGLFKNLVSLGERVTIKIISFIPLSVFFLVSLGTGTWDPSKTGVTTSSLLKCRFCTRYLQFYCSCYLPLFCVSVHGAEVPVLEDPETRIFIPPFVGRATTGQNRLPGR